MPVTGRKTLLPPALYPDGDFDYVLGVNALAERTSKLTTCDAEFWNLVRDTGVSHLYLVSGRGPLQAENLAGCAGLSWLYERESVTIFGVNRP